MAKIGEGTVEAMGRLGLKELRNAFNPSKESVADSELGMYGTATQAEINQDRGNDKGKETLNMDDLRADSRGAEDTGVHGTDEGTGRDEGRGNERGGRGR